MPSKKTPKQKLEINQPMQHNESLTEWLESQEEGQLSVDIFQDDKNIYVKSTIAGVKPENLEISVDNDMLTVRGFREDEMEVDEGDYFCKECFWGAFSRSVILPTDVKTDKITASLENGVLKITLPKLDRQRKIPIKVK